MRRAPRLCLLAELACLLLALTCPLRARATGGDVPLSWFVAMPGHEVPEGAVLVPVQPLIALPMDRAPLLPLPEGDGEAAEERVATLGALFLAEVLGPRPARPGRIGRGAKGLRDLIALVEAGPAGYDAVVYGARVPPPRPPTQMTLAEIEDWVAATPGQNHALGRYQIVPRTMAGLKRRLGLSEQARFTPKLQDRMADVLLADAGHAEFLAGRIDRTAFMRNLAAIWAGLPGPDGRSLYHGVAGNAAGISWAEYRARMERIYPG